MTSLPGLTQGALYDNSRCQMVNGLLCPNL